ncbi:MAG: hypothetical protein DRP45_08800 [Candidatus Zixiibacteriota bacterium]|nr:MAG: hypothetical protein DRP45_08800 [candidate division Zixibacteria bacterium]
MFRAAITVSLTMTIGAVAATATQDPLDLGGPDSVILVLTDQSSTPESDLTFALELYFVNDVQNVITATARFKWDNPNVVLDSSACSPLAEKAFNGWIGSWEPCGGVRDIDSVNAHRLFQFSGSRFFGDGLAPLPGRQHIATYWFHAISWPNPTHDSCVFDTCAFNGGSLLRFVDSDLNTYVPSWGPVVVIKSTTGVDESGGESFPSDFALEQNYPNPFNPTTEISFYLPEPARVRLEIFNVLGQRIATLVNDHLQAGSHTYSWNGGSSPSGIYFYRLEANEHSRTRKMLLLK